MQATARAGRRTPRNLSEEDILSGDSDIFASGDLVSFTGMQAFLCFSNRW